MANMVSTGQQQRRLLSAESRDRRIALQKTESLGMSLPCKSTLGSSVVLYGAVEGETTAIRGCHASMLHEADRASPRSQNKRHR